MNDSADSDLCFSYLATKRGEVFVRPCTIPGVARIALVLDSVGAQVGLWQPDEPKPYDWTSRKARSPK